MLERVDIVLNSNYLESNTYNSGWVTYVWVFYTSPPLGDPAPFSPLVTRTRNLQVGREGCLLSMQFPLQKCHTSSLDPERGRHPTTIADLKRTLGQT